MPHPRVVLVGSRGSGKSTLVASLSGVLLGTSTTCPIEWRMRRSVANIWSAQVSVAYFCQDLFDPRKLRIHSFLSLGSDGLCATPAQLLRLLRKAEVVAFSPGQDIELMDEATIARNYHGILLSSSPSKGVIYVDLRVPGFTPHEITIIDLPGLRETGYSAIIDYTKTVINFYATQEDIIIAVIIRITEPKPRARALCFIEAAGKLGQKTTVVLTHANGDVADTYWLKLLSAMERPYGTICFHIPYVCQQSSFAFGELELLRLRQEEAAYFLFSEPWSRLPSHSAANLGISNILKLWNRTWDLQETKPLARPPSLRNWRRFFMGLFVVFFIYFSGLTSA